MIRILVADDHGLLRDILLSELAKHPEFESISAAVDTDAAVLAASELRPDVVLMDMNLPGSCPFEATRKIRQLVPECRVLFLNGQEIDQHIEQAVQAGAAGYFLKCDGVDTLLEAIRTVAGGKYFFSEQIRKRLSVESGRPVLTQPGSPVFRILSKRERELLVHLGMGASLKEAAASMDVSYKTADNQKASLMRKLGVHDRVQLARLAIREGLVGVR